MSLFQKSVKPEEILETASEKAKKQLNYGEMWSRYQMIQYLYNCYGRDSLKLHDTVDVIESLFVKGLLKA